MDATHPIWCTPAVQEAAAAGRFGALIRMTRTARQLTLGQAGGLVGYSASTLSRIETGQRKLTDVTQLRRFAETLGIPPHLFGLTLPTAGAALLPSDVAPVTVGGNGREGDDEVRRRELLTGLVGVTGTGLLGIVAKPAAANAAASPRKLQALLTGGQVRAPVAVPVLRSRLAAAHAAFDACRYAELAGMLPSVIATGQASLGEARGERHDQVAALLAGAYCLASDLCSKLHDDALAWVTAEHARSAAAVSGDPASIVEAARMTSIAMRRHGNYDTATRLLVRTALGLGAESGKPAPGLLASYGSLLCTGAYTAAQHGSRHQALELIGEAETAAARLGTTQRTRTSFSPVNVTIYQIGIHTALGDSAAALDHARKIRLASVPTPERQARFCVDTARAWLSYGNPGHCLQALQTAGRCAPEELRRSSVRSLVASLLDTPGPTPAGLREFAARCGQG